MASYLTLKQAADMLGCSMSLLQKRCKDGTIPSIRVGVEYRIQPDDLNAWIHRDSGSIASKHRVPAGQPDDDLLHLLEGWIAHLTHVKALSPDTLRTHTWHLRSYLRRMRSSGSAALTLSLVFQRKTMATVFTTIPAKSFALKLNTFNAVVSFGKFLVDEGKLPATAIVDLRTLKPRRQVEPRRTCVREIDVQRIFDAILTRRRSVAENLGFASLVGVMVYAGLRVSEVCNLRPCDVDLVTRVLTVRHGKGGKDRRVGIGNALLSLLCDYDDVRLPGERYFMVTALRPYDRRGVQKRLETVARRLGIDVTCHGLRRTFATMADRNGRPINFIRQALGHANIQTTQAYLRTSEDEVVEQMKGW